MVFKIFSKIFVKTNLGQLKLCLSRSYLVTLPMKVRRHFRSHSLENARQNKFDFSSKKQTKVWILHFHRLSTFVSDLIIFLPSWYIVSNTVLIELLLSVLRKPFTNKVLTASSYANCSGFDKKHSSSMCNLRVIPDTEMVTSTRTPPQRLGNSKSYSATPSQSPRVNKSGQFSKSPSPKQQGKAHRGYHQASTTPTPKKMSVARSHSRWSWFNHLEVHFRVLNETLRVQKWVLSLVSVL